MIDDLDFIGYGANPADPQWLGGAGAGQRSREAAVANSAAVKSCFDAACRLTS